MTGTNQLEMKLHELNDKITTLKYEVERLKSLFENSAYGELCTDCRGGKK